MAKAEKLLFIGVSIALWVGLAFFAGGPIYSDEMLYIDMGLRNLVETHYGNRYFHVYLQKLFMALAPSPLIGIRIFWGFLMALTASLVYLNARTYYTGSTIFTGLLAVTIFFSYSIIDDYSGEPAVDITVMAVVIVYLTVYLDLLKRKGKGKYHLFFLGMLAFFGLKTKETAIFVNFVLVGLLFGRLKGKGWLRSLVQYFVPFLAGLLGAILIFIVLDSIFLGQPFFAIAPSTYQGVFDKYDYSTVFINKPSSWYAVYLLDETLVIFLLYIISGLLLRDQIEPEKRLVWLYPLVYIIFLSWNMLNIPWGVVVRFIFPALPVFAMLAAQSIDFTVLKKKWYIGAAILGAVGLFVILRQIWMQTADDFNMEYFAILDTVYFPILISVLLASMIQSRRSHWAVTILHIFILGTILLIPLSNNFKYFIRYPKVRARYAELFYPLEVFKEHLDIEDDDKFYISTDLKNGLDMLSIDPNDISGMVNFYFDERIDSENVNVGYNRKTVAADLINRPFDYALLTGFDVSSLSRGTTWDELAEIYSEIHKDEQGDVYLLKR